MPSALFQVELETAQQQISLLNQQKELLKERLEAVSDYPSVRKEKTELQGQLRLLKTQLEEAKEENRILQTGEALTRFPEPQRCVRTALYWPVSHEKVVVAKTTAC